LALTDRPPGSNGQGPLAPAPRPYNWRATAGLILGIVVVAGAMGVFMRVIPTPFTQPTPTSAPTARPIAQPAGAPAPATFAPTTAPLAAPTLAPAAQPTSEPITAPTAAPQPTPAPTAASATTQPATAAAVPPGAAAAPPTELSAPTGERAAATVVAAAASAPPPQPKAIPVQVAISPELAREILQGYSDYWSVRVRAMRDPSDANLELDSAMAGTELARAQQVLADYQQQGKAYVVDVRHQIWITQATSTEAAVVDAYLATSLPVDPDTKQPLNPDAGPNIEYLQTTFLLENVGGSWKVTDQQGEQAEGA
jgi:hypothetical protein